MITAHSPPGAMKSARVVYDFDAHGGAQGDIGLGLNLPEGAIVVSPWYEVLTPPASGGAATIAIGIPVDDVDGILGATPYDNAGAFGAGYHDTLIGWDPGDYSVKTTANREVTLTIAGADLTAGKIALHALYFTGA